MTDDVLASSSSADRARYRRKVQRCLDTLAQMLAEGSFISRPQLSGLAIELNLIDEQMLPSMTNSEVLAALDDPSFTTELGKHNLERNVPPRRLVADSLLDLDLELRNC